VPRPFGWQPVGGSEDAITQYAPAEPRRWQLTSVHQLESSGPADSDSVRDSLLAAIRSHKDEFEAAGEQAEELRTLPPGTVETLRDMGVFWLKTPAELGGTPLSPLDFSDVIEELAYADPSTAWAAMIGAGCAGLASGWLPEAGALQMFAPGRRLPIVAGQLQPRGTGRPVKDGYLVRGRWSFASGIMHADWLIGAFRPESGNTEAASTGFASTGSASTEAVPGPGGERMVIFVLPKEEAEVIDNWRVAGLQGTGSMDFRLEDVFVPADRTYDLGSAAVRGGALFRLGMPAFVSNEVPPLCIGMARRALDEITALAGRTARWPGGPTLAHRAVFLKELGRAEVRIKAARLVHRDAMQAVWNTALRGVVPPPPEQTAVTVASVFAVETCAEVISDLFRYGGGRVLSLASPLQRYLRDALAARQHVAVSEEFYEAAGRERVSAAKP
jgi:indole-3-acetate monooxygenase